MNSILTCQHPATNLTTPKTLHRQETSRTRPPPDFLKVLIVDDNKGRGTANAKIISRLAHAVELARDGITALRMAAANRPDAVLLNINFRGPGERNVARHLRSDYPDHPPLIIGFATRTDSLTRWQCVMAGMDLVLQAPLNATAIETLLLFECAKLRVERTQIRRRVHNIGRCTFQHNPIEVNQLLSSQRMNI